MAAIPLCTSLVPQNAVPEEEDVEGVVVVEDLECRQGEPKVPLVSTIPLVQWKACGIYTYYGYPLFIHKSIDHIRE